MAKDANLVFIFIYSVSLLSGFFSSKEKKHQPMLHFVHRNVFHVVNLGKNYSN